MGNKSTALRRFCVSVARQPAQPAPSIPGPTPTEASASRRRILSAQTIRGLKPPVSGRVDYFDESTPGLSLRISAKDRRTWTLFYRTVAGVQKRLTLGQYPAIGLADARDLAQDALRNAAKGHDPAEAKRAAREAWTFGDLAAEYLERHAKLMKKSWKEDERQLNADLLPRWRNIPAASLHRRDVRDVLDRLVDRGATCGANRLRALISKVYNFGLAREIVDHNPVMGVPKPSPEKTRERVLTEDEIRRVWQACNTQSPRVAAWFRLRLATGQRGGEILQMRWQDLDGDWWTIPPEFVKNQHGHRVYLNRVARDIIDTLYRSEESVWVFPLSSMGDYKHVGRRLASDTRANIENFRGHDLRRTAASFMTRRGVPRFIVARILNHSVDKDITGVYDRYSYDREKQAAMQFWAKQLRAILADQPVTRVGRFRA